MPIPHIEPARASLVTCAGQGRPTYHLLELTPDLVPLFEAVDGPSSSGDGLKRPHVGENGDGQKRRQRICIKGRLNDEAVLCTDTDTFAIRQVTQSNSLLLCSLGGGGEVIVRDNVMQQFELVPIVARTAGLERLLGESLYAGDGEEAEEEEESMASQRRYTMQHAASIIQASPAELLVALRDAYVVELDGCLRMMQCGYLARALHVLLAHLDRLALDPERVMLAPAVSALQTMHEMRREAAEALLTLWFGQRHAREDEGEEATVRLDRRAITRYIGLHLLRERANVAAVDLESFMDGWRQSCGALLADDVSLALLNGSHICFPEPPAVATKLQPAQIRHFPTSELPLDVSARFQTLFSLRQRWTAEDLSPFLADVAIDKKRRDALLLKFARSSVVQVPVTETKADRRTRLRNGVPHPPTKSVQLYSARLRYGA